jgi:hypothetical protein
MIHVHLKHPEGVGTIMTTRNSQPSRYGVVVGDVKSGMIEHFVNRPECARCLRVQRVCARARTRTPVAYDALTLCSIRGSRRRRGRANSARRAACVRALAGRTCPT